MKRRMITIIIAILGLFVQSVVFADAPVLRVVAPWEVSSKDPSRAGYVYARLEVAQTLVDADLLGNHVPGLASGWSVSEDGLTWRFDLRPGVRFHDKTLMTSEAVLQSLLIAQGKPGVLNRAPIEAILVDGESVVVTLSRPFSPLPSFLTHFSTVVLAPDSYADDGTVRDVIGTGPYRIVQLQQPQSMEVEAFEQYWGRQPKIQRAGYLAAGRGETRALLAESGEAHVMFTIDPASLRRMENARHLNVLTVPLPRIVSLKLNCAHPGMDDVRARQALSLAIDRAGIATAILRQPEFVANQYFPPSMKGWHNPDISPLRHDPGEAMSLLEAAGWRKNGKDMLERDGKPFKVEMVVYPDRPELPLIAAAVQDQWRSIGVDARISINNSSEIPARHKDDSLEVGVISRLLALVPDPLGILVQDFSSEGGDWGAMNWSDEGLTALLTELMESEDTAAMVDQKQGLVDILHAQMPLIPVSWYQHTAAVSKKVRNVIIDPYERVYNISAMEWGEE